VADQDRADQDRADQDRADQDRADQDWAVLAEHLSGFLLGAVRGDTLILRHGRRYAQVVHAGAEIYAEAVSDAFLPPAERLSAGQHRALIDLGWRAPEPPADRNYWCEIPATPIQEPDATRLAGMAVRTLRSVHGVRRPADLEVEGWNDESRQPLHFTLPDVARLRLARVYDGVREPGGPYFADGHPRIGDSLERDRITRFLRSGTPVMVTSERDTDRIDPARGAVVPMSFRTDGHWVWSDALGYYLEVHGIAPEPDFVRHIAGCGYHADAPDPLALRAAVAAVLPPQS
jgi:hypothetical protein